MLRQCLLLFLLIVLPLQFTWAVASSYCRHEPPRAQQHFGHHEHQHQDSAQESTAQAAATLDASAPSTLNAAIDQDQDLPKTNSEVLSGDADCAACHAGCTPALADMTPSSHPGLCNSAAASYSGHLPSPPPVPLERPQWSARA